MLKKYFRYLRKSSQNLYEKDILTLLEPNAGAKLLDIGSSDGAWTKKIADRVRTKDIYAVEIVPELAKKAEALGIKVSLGDISQKFPFSDNYFDCVHANQVIEHLYKTEHFVEEIKRVLKKGGYAIIATENLASWHNIFSLLFGWMPMSSANYSKIKYNVGNPLALHNNEDTTYPESFQHIRVLSIRGLLDLFKLHGFRLEKIKGAGYYPLPAKFARLDVTHAAFLTAKFRKL